MALIHRATLRPTKLELLTGWLPGHPWYTAAAGDLERVAGYRFDDPADAVGIETLLVRAGAGPVHQVPLTYRGEPLAGAEAWLIGSTEHSVLGRRWVYDDTGDPVYAAALTTAVLGRTGQAEEVVRVGGGLEPRALTMDIASTASPGTAVPAVTEVVRVIPGELTVIVTDTVELTVARVPGTALTGMVLTGTWPGRDTPAALASVR